MHNASIDFNRIMDNLAVTFGVDAENARRDLAEARRSRDKVYSLVSTDSAKFLADSEVKAAERKSLVADDRLAAAKAGFFYVAADDPTNFRFMIEYSDTLGLAYRQNRVRHEPEPAPKPAPAVEVPEPEPFTAPIQLAGAATSQVTYTLEQVSQPGWQQRFPHIVRALANDTAVCIG